ncbi:MAG: hypothetical protein KIT60_13915 [Burkholderiaceae bacterium]|nr:hypothetical protein [Burkholderiaceae bacterium]
MRTLLYRVSLIVVAAFVSSAMAADKAPAAAPAQGDSRSVQCGNSKRHQHGATEKGAPALPDCAAAPASGVKRGHDHQKVHKQG